MSVLSPQDDTPKNDDSQASLTSSVENPPEILTTNPYRSSPQDIYDAMLQEDRMRRSRMMGDLRFSHARQRASLAARFNSLPRTDPLGGMASLDYYDDGVFNMSAPYMTSRYGRKNLWP